ncbi:MAG: hypothetical protein EOP84_28535, partial [Verrucomicrobiaceae bacterium]
MSSVKDRVFEGGLALLWAAAMSGCSTTVLTASCDRPKVSNSSTPYVYLVMLPYGYKDSKASQHESRAAADALNDVARLQVVRMGAETTNMHVTLLDESEKKCNIESVYKEFTATRFFERNLRSTVVFYWGEVYEVDDAVQVRSHMRTLWKNPKENLIEVDVRTPDRGTNFRFTGWVPYATVSFPARKLPVGSRLSEGGELRMSLQARATPDAENLAPLPKSFTIQQRKGEWVELQERSTARSVWVNLNDPGTYAKAVLPELSFAHAMSAFASFGRLPKRDTAEDAITWLNEYRAAYKQAELDEELAPSMAIAAIVEAVLLRYRGLRDENRGAADQLIEQAVKALPVNSAVLNLAAILQIDKCCKTKEAMTLIQSRLETARILDVGNEIIARNLLNWYRFLDTQDEALLPR